VGAFLFGMLIAGLNFFAPRAKKFVEAARRRERRERRVASTADFSQVADPRLEKSSGAAHPVGLFVWSAQCLFFASRQATTPLLN